MEKTKKGFQIFLAGLMTFMICSTVVMAAENYRDVTAEEASEMIQEAGKKTPVAVLDVRTKGEFDAGHLDNARNIDVMKSESFREEVSRLNKDDTYLVYCRSGKRSKMAQNIMKELGFRKAINMLGGFMAWEKAGLPYSK